MAVRLRMKRLGRRHRPFFRICAMDSHAPRDGRVIEELGHYDPMVGETDARVVLKRERIDYWMSVGALPTPKVAVLIRKYGTGGTHLAENEEALKKLKEERKRRVPVAVVAASEGEVEETSVEEQVEAVEAAVEEASEETTE